MDNIPQSGFQFTGEDYGPVDYPSSIPSDMQVGMTFAGGGPVFPQNQRSSNYGMSPFHINYSQPTAMAAVAGLPPGPFRARFTEYPTEQSPHLPMSLPSSASGIINDRLPSFSTIVSNSSASGVDIVKSSQSLYSSISGQQHAFLPSGTRGLQGSFDSSPYAEQTAGKAYSKSPSHGSASPGISGSSYSSSIASSSLLQHSAHNGSSQHLSSHSPRSYKEEVSLQQQYLGGGMHVGYSHGGVAHHSGESMTLPKFKHKYHSHNQHIPRRYIGPFKFFIIGKTERPLLLHKATQTKEDIGELKIKIPKAETYRSESEVEFVNNASGRPRRHANVQNVANYRGSQRITFPYDPLPPSQEDYTNYNINKVKTVISPSFIEAAGKATMTTCVSNKATIVTVGIVSRPSNLNGAEPTDSISHRGIMAVGDGSSSEQQMDSYEQLLEERKIKVQDLEHERMEVSVRIDDNQFVQTGGVKRWQCNKCDKSYTTKHNLVMHVLDHSGIKPHLCLKCGKYFKQLSHLNTHMLTHDHIKPHTCNLCGKGFTQISHLKRHMAVSEKNGYCATLRSKHLSGLSPVSSQLGSSMAIHSPRKRYSSQNQIFEPVDSFDEVEMKKEEKLGTDGHLLCRFCDRRFRYPSQLKDHVQSHSGHRPFICTECGMDFMKEHHLKAHLFTHTGLKPYTCEVCGRAFNQRANLQRHKLIHETSRSFKCSTCGKLFTQPQTLKAHQVVHADHKPYECSICGKEFGRYHNLQGHMHMHSNTKPYICFCGSTFTLKGNLNRHKKVKHGLNETTDVMEEDAVNFLSSLSERVRDDQNEDEELDDGLKHDDTELDSPGSGADSNDGKMGRKGRKSIPRKITQEEEEGACPENQVQDQTDRTDVPVPNTNHPPAGPHQKSFFIQNPDTDDEVDEELRGIHVQPTVVNSLKEDSLIHPSGNMMSFQPINAPGVSEPVMEHAGTSQEELPESEKHLPQESTEPSPNTHQQSGASCDGVNTVDHSATDWMPGYRNRSRDPSDQLVDK